MKRAFRQRIYPPASCVARIAAAPSTRANEGEIGNKDGNYPNGGPPSFRGRIVPEEASFLKHARGSESALKLKICGRVGHRQRSCLRVLERL